MTWTKRSRRAIATTAAASMLGAGLVAATGAPASAQLGATDVLADFEAGAPPGFFVFNGGASSVATDPNNGILDVSYTVNDFGGFGQNMALAAGEPQDWSRYQSFDFWFQGTASGRTYQAEIGDNGPDADNAERFDYSFTDTTVGWQYLSIPFSDFTRATDFQPGGAPDDGFGLTEIWSWAIVLPGGSDAIAFDDFALGLAVVDDFEQELPSGEDADGIPIGFYTFEGAESPISISRSGSAPELPAMRGEANNVLQMDVDSRSYAGFIHGFANDGVDTWVSQDWSRYEGIQLWLYGNDSGTDMFLDLLENRNPGSTKDDAERWTATFVDDFSGWQLLQFPFSSMSPKGIGNGAPNDGLTLKEMHGWALGVLGTGGPRTYYVDNVALYGVGVPAPPSVSFAVNNFGIEEGTTGNVEVKLNRPLEEDDDPDQVSVSYRTEIEASIAIEGREYAPTSGTLTFVKGGPTTQSFELQTFDDTKWEGDERIVVRLYDFVDVAPGGPSPNSVQGSVFILDNDKYDKRLLDDFERGAYLWSGSEDVAISAPELESSDPMARPGQDDVEAIMEVTTPVVVDAEPMVSIDSLGTLCTSGEGVIPVRVLSTPEFDARQIDHTTVQLGDASEAHTHGKNKKPTKHLGDANGDRLKDLVFHFRANETGYDCDSTDLVLTGELKDGTPFVGKSTPVAFGRDFAMGQDWSKEAGLKFWYYGTGTGDEVKVTLKDNRTRNQGPSKWGLVWSDEFNEAAGTQPSESNWNFEIGDVTPDGKNGWGNDELEYYTDDPDNAATDGNGNLAITLREAGDSRECYYGTCEYTSARLTSWNKAEFAYGRIESRIKVPSGTGIWPAFWSLGTDIDRVAWPQTGEIDFMEYVGRLPDEIFGTIHGPGYSGGASFGGIQAIPDVAADYHTYTVEWEPDLITWYVDGIKYHEATPADVAPNEWVFNDPVFLLLNVAVGGNFGGPVGEDLTTPASMLVDYVRVYQAPDTAERFESSFTDSEAGWREVTVPFDTFTRSADQPKGAPRDGLGLDEVWGYGFELPKGGTTTGSVRVDYVTLDPKPRPTVVTVTNTNDSGDGSLRQALADVAAGGTVDFDPSLAGKTIGLTTGPLVAQAPYDATIDATAAPGLTLDGGGVDRVLVIDAGVEVTVRNLKITNGYGWQVGGGVLNNGTLTLDHVTVTGNTMATDAGDFWQGGGGIYNGGGATLTLVDSTVSDNTARWSGGGVYSFFDTTTNIVRSTISGNTTDDVGGGLRTLGTVMIDNSTISGNTATGWHGGAIFVTDGVATITNSTVTANRSPVTDQSAVFVGTFGDSSATLNLQNTIVAGNTDVDDNRGAQCFLAPYGAGAVAINSLGTNVFADGSCNPDPSDQVVVDPLLGLLGDNGGPTLTHELLDGSPAIDAANAGAAPAVDQRGLPRDTTPDVGSFEVQSG